jgi:hypothetical protein
MNCVKVGSEVGTIWMDFDAGNNRNELNSFPMSHSESPVMILTISEKM